MRWKERVIERERMKERKRERVKEREYYLFITSHQFSFPLLFDFFF